MKKGSRAFLIIALVVVVGGGFVYAFRAKIFPASAQASASANAEASYTRVKVSRGDISLAVAASGKLEPKTMTTVRPDSNMPTRKLVRILVQEGETVQANQGVAEVDASGLDLELASAKASYEAQVVKLQNLKARPTPLELAQAEADLASSRLSLQQAKDSYANAKALVEKDLAPKNQLSDAERQMNLAQARYDSAKLDYDEVRAGPTSDVISAQESSVAQTSNAYQKARLIASSTTIRAPVGGVVADVPVKVGDLVGPNTAIVTVIDNNPMVLQAQVNENDVGQVEVGQSATVTPSPFPDMTLRGTVVALDLKAQVQGNVSSYYASIEVPNRDRKLLWGMNADAEIEVLQVTNVLTLPASAVKQSGTASQVTILDGEQLISWDIQTGATDGVKTQVVAGLEEGDEVAIAARKTTATTTAPNQRQGGGNPFGGVMGIFR